MALSKVAIDSMYSAIDRLFDRLAIRLVGPQLFDKKVKIRLLREFSIPGIFEAACEEEGIEPDQKLLSSVTEIAKNYIDSYRAVAKARVVKEVDAFLNHAIARGIQTDVETVLGGQLAEVWKDVSNSVHKMVDAEVNMVKNVGFMDAVSQISEQNGVSDPVVYFSVVMDDALCDECRRLHLMGDNHTPRLWYMSEVGHGYHKKGDSNPKISGLHPHCRCSLCHMPPGYGFNDAGNLAFKHVGYDAIKVQRG